MASLLLCYCCKTARRCFETFCSRKFRILALAKNFPLSRKTFMEILFTIRLWRCVADAVDIKQELRIVRCGVLLLSAVAILIEGLFYLDLDMRPSAKNQYTLDHHTDNRHICHGHGIHGPETVADQ